jgi:hypothetical protein
MDGHAEGAFQFYVQSEGAACVGVAMYRNGIAKAEFLQNTAAFTISI